MTNRPRFLYEQVAQLLDRYAFATGTEFPDWLMQEDWDRPPDGPYMFIVDQRVARSVAQAEKWPLGHPIEAFTEHESIIGQYTPAEVQQRIRELVAHQILDLVRGRTRLILDSHAPALDAYGRRLSDG